MKENPMIYPHGFRQLHLFQTVHQELASHLGGRTYEGFFPMVDKSSALPQKNEG